MGVPSSKSCIVEQEPSLPSNLHAMSQPLLPLYLKESLSFVVGLFRNEPTISFWQFTSFLAHRVLPLGSSPVILRDVLKGSE